MRLTVIDGLRGIFLIFMMIIHANVILKTSAGKLNHHYFGWVEDAQGFVFMSGLVVGLVYGGRYLRQGYQAMHHAIWIRIRTIYSHQIFLIFLFLCTTMLFIHFGDATPSAFLPYESEPVLFPIFSSMLVAGSMHMGILPMYIFFMMATPLFLRLLNKKLYMIYAAIIITSWAIAQTQLSDQLVNALESIISSNGYNIEMGIFFNILGWQALFFGGLFLGFMMAAKRLRTNFLNSNEMRLVFFVCLGMFFLYGLYDRIIFDGWISIEFSDKIKDEADRGNLSTIYLIAFIIDLILVSWLLGPGRSDSNIVIQTTANGLYRTITFYPFVFLGQHSLHVFTAHIIIVYVLATIYQTHAPGELLGIFIIVACVGTLYVTAWIHSKFVERGKMSKTF